MRLGPRIADSEQGIPRQLPFDRKEIVLIIGISVAGRWGRHARLGQKWREINVRVRMRQGCIERREFKRERLNVLNSVGCTDERCRKERRRWTGVTRTIRRL